MALRKWMAGLLATSLAATALSLAAAVPAAARLVEAGQWKMPEPSPRT